MPVEVGWTQAGRPHRHGCWRRTPPGYGAESGPAPPAWRRSGCRGCGHPGLRASQASAAAAMRARWRVGDRPGGIVEVLARLDLDEDQQAAPAGDDVDLADRAAPAPRQDAKALGDEKGRRPAFRRNAGAERDLALGPRRWRGAERRGARSLIGHGRAPWRAPARADRRRGADWPVTAATSADRLLDRDAVERLAQQRVELAGVGSPCGIGRRDHDHDLAARLRRAARTRAPGLGRSPRRTSSWSLVSSRQIAASRGPSPSARSASAAASRGPVSNSTSVAGMRRARRCARAAAPPSRGRKPSKKNRSVGSAAHHQRRQHRGRARAPPSRCAPCSRAARTSL